MKRALLLAAVSVLTLASPAWAQQAGHSGAAPDPHAGHVTQPRANTPAPADSCTPEHAAMGHCTLQPMTAAPPTGDPHAGHEMPADRSVDPHAGHSAEPETLPTDPHAGHGQSSAQQPDPHAGHSMSEPQTQDPHAGHAMPGQSSDPHAGHAMPSMSQTQAPPVAPPPPEAFSGPEHAGTTIFDPELFLRKREEELIREHGGYVTWMVLADQLEYRAQEGRDGYKWDIQGWYGGDYDKLWLKSEGEGEFGHSPEQAEVQALYSRALDPWFNLQAGIRHDFRPNSDRTHLVVGIQGLAPYWFEVDGQLFLSNKGDVTARFEAEYDQRITNKLILQPLVEFDLAAQDIPELGIGSGLSSAEIGARLRYEFVPEFAPYVGVEYERSFGDTARFARAAGEDVGGWSFLVGLRSWF
ncbi:copper resistance protein B [Sphingosinicella humi]|uniref:Copper resistance protein CopB n=1 Tax=Allosphingosinicella humi TaxID=2068657 RepID=A0A2U2J0U6_9SPHN|nr:copper resistance protein B [Sphingosinicella humi]PWG01966.1 copper resistance protein CopB [Sphingosinicella humi]